MPVLKGNEAAHAQHVQVRNLSVRGRQRAVGGSRWRRPALRGPHWWDLVVLVLGGISLGLRMRLMCASHVALDVVGDEMCRLSRTLLEVVEVLSRTTRSLSEVSCSLRVL